jgi:hypothetical protein
VGGSVVATGVSAVRTVAHLARRRRGHPHRRRLLVASTVTVAMLLTACGSGEEVAGDDPDQAGADLVAEEDTGERVEEGADEVAAEPAPEADSTEDADENEGGVRAHRPPDDAEAFADCGSIGEQVPGAVIRFPDEDVSGSLDAGAGPVTVEVVGCGNTFEANVQWEAYHGDNRTPTLEGHTMGGTMGDWGAFSIAETYWTPGDWTVVVFEIDAESGERREYDEVTFTVG